jgi:hypothetical protein
MRATNDAGSSSDTRTGHPVLIIHGLLDGVRGLATAGTKAEGPWGIKAAFVPAYSGVADPGKAGVDKLSEEASKLLSKGDEVEALKVLSRVVGMDPEAAASVKLDLILGGKVIGQVSLHARRRAVSVLVHPDRLKAENSNAVIEFAGENPPPSMRRKLAPVEGASYLLAEFEDLPDGRFALGLEFPDY